MWFLFAKWNADRDSGNELGNFLLTVTDKIRLVNLWDGDNRPEINQIHIEEKTAHAQTRIDYDFYRSKNQENV